MVACPAHHNAPPHPLSNNRESGPLLSRAIRSEQSQLFPSLPVFAAHTSFLLLPGAKLVQRSSTCISLVKKILLCSTPCPAAASSFSSQAPSLADANYQLLFPAVEPSAVAGRKQMCRAFGSPGHTGHSKQLLLPGAGWWGLQGWAQQVPHHHQGHTQLGEHILWHWESSFH